MRISSPSILAAAKRCPGVVAVLDGADIKALTTSLVVGVKAPVECWPIAVGRVRYVGEPVAVVVATDRYLAEDAVDLIEVRVSAAACGGRSARGARADAPVLHDGFNGNVASDRRFRYGDPEQAFASAAHRISIDIRYPRNSCTPIETYGVVAEYDPGEDAYDVLANFQGPFSIHAVMSRALKVPGNRAAAAHAAGFRRQFRRQAGRLSLHRADRRGRARRRASGQMDRGPARTSDRLGFRHQPRHDARAPPSPTTAASSRSTGTRSRIAARICARPSRRRCIGCTAT